MSQVANHQTPPQSATSTRMPVGGRLIIITTCLLAMWQILVWVTQVPAFILPSPWQVAVSFGTHLSFLIYHAGVTLTEIILGLIIGTLLGLASALLMVRFGQLHYWMMPVLVVSQAIPVFALAPILVLWLGYGLASKVAMAVLIIYFPVTASCYDGLRHTDSEWMDLAHTLGATPWTTLRYIRFPAALPALASGLRIAASIAPIGAVIGEWVGSSAGLGHVMLHANGRMQIDLMFAALFVLALIALAIYFTIDIALRRLLHWLPDQRSTFSTQPSTH